VVVLKIVSSEEEAEIVCGLLRAGGFECGSRVTEEVDSALEGYTGSGPREILVHVADLAAAKGLLADPEA